MSIIINIDVMLAKRKMSVTELSERVGITMANISVLKNGKAKAVKISTLNSICKALTVSRGIFWNMWKTEMMKTMKTKDLNQIMSVLYLGLGYGFVYLWSSWTSEWRLTLFTAAYAIAVLGYCYGSGRKPAVRAGSG